MAVAAANIPVLDTIRELGPRYRAWLVDIWGVMHNGRRAFPRAVAATRAFREEGGIVDSAFELAAAESFRQGPAPPSWRSGRCL